MQQFSPSEQASLVWQFICSVPVIVLEDLLPWMYSFFCPEKQVEIVQCIRQMVPKGESLQEVDPELISLPSINQHSDCDYLIWC
jgi:zinc finger-like protein